MKLFAPLFIALLIVTTRAAPPNFCRVHQILRVTPAMEAGLSHRVCTLDEVIGLLE